MVHRLLQSPATGVDDADIFLTYARNLSAGHGFVFNVGGEHVEGFTSLLWVLICTATVSLANTPERALLAISIGLTAASAAACLGSPVLRRTARDPRLSPPWTGALLVLLCCDSRFVTWNTVTLMDTSLWTCLLTASALAASDDRLAPNRLAWSLAALNVLLILTRPEALLWTPLLALLFFFTHSASRDRTGLFRMMAPPVSAIDHRRPPDVLQTAHFGYPANTYYAKVSPSLSRSLIEGFTYLWAYTRSNVVTCVSFAALCVSTVHLLRVRFQDRQTLALTLLVATGLAVPVLAGGDHFVGFRFYQSVFPLLVLMLLNCARFVLPRYLSMPTRPVLRRAAEVGGAAVLGTWFVIAQVFDWTDATGPTGLAREFEIAVLGRKEGRRIAELFTPGDRLPSVATITVGGLKYGYPGEIIDLMGLNNTRMAHNGGMRIGYRSHAAFEKRTFYDLHPTMLVPHSRHSREEAWKRPSSKTS
jgi:hypothetical protein